MDKVTRFLVYEGRASLIIAETTDLVEEIRKIHDLTPTTTAAMGRLATISGMMGFTDIKEDDDSISIQIKGDGQMGSLVSVIRRESNTVKLKMCCDNPHVEPPLKENGKLDVGAAVGRYGFLNVIKKNEMTNSDYNGLVPLVSGEIAEDFTDYYAKSKQIPTVLSLGVLVNKDGTKAAGGYLLQLMPDATEEDIDKIEEASKKVKPISVMIDEKLSLEEIAKLVSGDENATPIKEELSIKYECDCDKEKFKKGIISLGKEEITKIIEEDNHAEIECHFCKKKYDFSKSELENLRQKAK
jgi:molecular chaperone Hsp33